MRSVAFALLAGCYHPTPPQGAPCAANGDCPSPLTCQQGVCVSDGTVDAATGIDSAMIDAPGMMVASNGVVPMFPPGNTTIQIAGLATFNTDTGEVTGALIRQPGEGVLAGIDFHRMATSSPPGLGVFSFHRLTITTSGTVHFTGAAAAVFAVARDATISGTIDGGGGCYGATRTCAGPGGGTGASTGTPAIGCGPGGDGAHDLSTQGDTGGGGAGGGADGGRGGDTTATSAITGANGGSKCIASTIEPLVGGSGGGLGGSGTVGGGGGGAFQLSVFDQLSLGGTIAMGGAGGDGGQVSGEAGAGGGGGAGGAILLEAEVIQINSSAVIAANGGGGGGGGYSTAVGGVGSDGQASTQPAPGGSGVITGGGAGGDGGARSASANPGASGAINGGGGGGGAGRVYFRASTLTGTGQAISPAAGTGPIHTQ